MKRFEGKIAIITGASTGLGPVMAKMIAAEGAKLVLAARKGHLCEEIAHDIGENAIGMKADVTDEDDVAKMVGVAMDTWGQVDAMMSNAAVPGTDKWIWEQTVDNFIDTYKVDCMAAMLCSREVLNRSMLERKSGSILTFSSGAGWSGMERKAHYSAAKGALIVLSKTIAKEVGPYGIRCNCLVPGAIDTELLQNYHKRIAGEREVPVEEVRAEAAADVPLKIFSTPEDIANMALFLASDQARTITGQAINVDAGFTI
ncbi:MAG: SDR family oxidoreductase [Novosphingobium sp.]|nr:SDR family oxidoreductase [Novosphingobium sp.]